MQAAQTYYLLLIYAVLAVLTPLIPLGLGKLWSKFVAPAKPGPYKQSIYECGLESKGDAWIQFKSHYYLYAIVFLVFDVESLFLLPLAVAFPGLSPAAAFVGLVFILLLSESLVWAWSKGYLEWT